MTIENPNVNPDPSGKTPEASGEGENQTKNGSVAYESYEKVLSEKKRMQSKYQEAQKMIETFQQQQKEQEEKALREKEDYKRIAEIKENEAKEAKNKLLAFEAEKKQAMKLHSFLDGIGGKLDRKYWGLIDVDNIVINPESGEVDTDSLNSVVNEFKNNYSEILFGRKDHTKMPNGSPGGGTGLSYEEWLKLPTSEMKRRIGEIKKQ